MDLVANGDQQYSPASIHKYLHKWRKLFDKIKKYEIKVSDLEPRLQRRYRKLVCGYMSLTPSVASLLLAEVEQKLEEEFRAVGQVQYQGRAARQWQTNETRRGLSHSGTVVGKVAVSLFN